MNRFYVKIRSDIDKYLAIFGIIASLILIVYCSITISRIIYLFPGILTFFVCIGWLFLRKNLALSQNLKESQRIFFLLIILFIILLFFSLLLFRFRPEIYKRPLLFFILTAFMASTIGCEILFANKRYSSLILIQIIILGASIAWSQLVLFSNVVGVDPWFHQMVTLKIINFGYIPLGLSYSHLPIFHIIIAITSLFSNLNYKIAAIFSVSIAQIIYNTIFIYLLGVLITKNYKIGLLSSLMVILASHHINMSYWSIPNGFGVIFIPIIIYLVFKNDFKSIFPRIFLVILLSFTLIFTHPLASLNMALILIAIYILSTIYNILEQKKEKIIPITIPIFFTIAMFTWWSYASGNLFTLTNLFEWGFSRDKFISKTSMDIFSTYVQQIPLKEQIFNQLGMFLFFALSFIGVLFLISRWEKKNIILACIGILPLFIAFFSLISGLSVIEHRWYYLAQIILSIPLGIALFLLMGKIKNFPLKIIGVYSLIFLFAFVLIMSPEANSDNALFSPNTHVRVGSYESELQVVTFLDNYSGVIKTDNLYAWRLSYLGPYNTHSFDDNLDSNYFFNLKGYFVLVRDAIMAEPFMHYQSIYKLNYNLNNVLIMNGFSQVYNSGTVHGYI